MFDAPRDCAYAAAAHPLFEKVLTVFTQEWVGIRAAAGSLPGRKLAVSKKAVWSEFEFRNVFHAIDEAGIQIVLVQGASFPLLDLALAIRQAMPDLTIVGVWHGTLAAWAFDEESALGNRFLELTTNGVFDRICFLRQGMHLLHPKAVHYSVPNLPPRTGVRRLTRPFQRKPIACLFGSWNNQWKNMYANIVGAASSHVVAKILTYTPANLPEPMDAKVKTLAYSDRRAHFINLASADLVLNVTIADCHPMVELEALAVGTPVLRSQLELDFEKKHPFSRHFTVDAPHNPAAIRARLEEVASIPYAEITDIVADYRALVEKTSYEYYGALLMGDA